MPKAADTTPVPDAIEPVARNRRARFDYEIIDSWEAGIVLTGTEEKSFEFSL